MVVAEPKAIPMESGSMNALGSQFGLAAQEVAALKAMMGQLVNTGQKTHQYYRLSDGWITVGEANDFEVLRRTRRRGQEPLTQYGRFDIYPWTLTSPLENLIFLGGVHEISVDQITHLGWHIDPPQLPKCGMILSPAHIYDGAHPSGCWTATQTIEFPQLRGLTLPGYVFCDYCGRKFTDPKARDQHASVMHRDERNQEVLGKSISNGIARVLGGQAQGEGSHTSTLQTDQIIAIVQTVLAGLDIRPRDRGAAAGGTADTAVKEGPK